MASAALDSKPMGSLLTSWAGATGVLVAIFVVSGCRGETAWQTFEARADGFAARFPGRPEVATRPVPPFGESKVIKLDRGAHGQMQVAWSDLPGSELTDTERTRSDGAAFLGSFTLLGP